MSTKREKVGAFLRKNYQFFLAFLIPFAVLFLCYAIFGVWPFGKRSVLALDLNGQYVCYYDSVYNILNGSESLFYSWSRNMSGEMMGIIGYYLASPFNIFVWLFPREMITEGLLTMMLMKVGACGLTMSLFLTKYRGMSRLTSVIFPTMYALCSYFIVQTMNPMWLDGVLVLPLVVWGVEALVREGKWKLVTFSLIYAFVTNFYIGYMIGIFSALYFITFMVSSGMKWSWSYVWTRCTLFGYCAIASVLSSCFMILPVYKSLSLGKFEFSVPDYSLRQNFDFVNLIPKFLPNSYDTVRMEGLPFLYCGIVTLILVPLYFACRKYRLREKLANGALMAVLFLCMYITPIDMLWHGGQLPNWLPYRYSFMISFLMVLFAAKAFERLDRIKPKYIAICAAVIVGLIIYAESFNNEKFNDVTVLLPAAVIVVIMAVLLYNIKRFRNVKAMCIILTVAIAAEAFYSTFIQLYKTHSDIVYSNRDTYLDVIPETREVVDAVYAQDDDFYRMEKTYHRTVNDPIALGMYGMSHSSSTLNAKIIETIGLLGYTARSHYTRYDGATPLTDDLMGFRYILSKDSKTLPYTTETDISPNEDITVYENENALGIAYLASSDVLDFEFDEDQPFNSQNMLMAALLGEKTAYIFKPITEKSYELENIKEGRASGGHDSFKKIDADKNTQIHYYITPNYNYPVYMYLPTNYERQLNVWINEEYYGHYYEYEDYNIKYLGTYEPGEQFHLGLTLAKDDCYVKEFLFYFCDTDRLDECTAKLQEKNTDTVVDKISGDHLEISVNADEDCVLFTTIPAQEGWTVWVDGEKTEYEVSVNDSLITIPVTTGKHTITMKFIPAGLETGLLMTGAGLFMIAILIIVFAFLRKPVKLVPLTDDEKNSQNDNEFLNEFDVNVDDEA